MKTTTHQVEYRAISELNELEGNPRTIKKDDFERLKKSLQDNQDYFEARPLILSDRTGKLVIIAGNQRYKAAKAIGLTEVPTVLLSGLSKEREREIVIRDNVENGEWDMDILANEWDTTDLKEWGADVNWEAAADDLLEEDGELGTEKKYLNLIEGIYKKHIVIIRITLKHWILPSKSNKKSRMYALAISIQYFTGSSSHSN